MLDDFYFHTIDSEAKAYFIGFLLADGCITKHHGVYRQIQLHLSTVDMEILELLKELTASTRNIYISPDNKRCMFRDSSDIMVHDLAKFGIVPKKTGEEHPNFDSIPKELIHHTIRGLIDGDGWISIGHSATGRTIYSLGICGSKYTCEYVTRILSANAHVGVLSASKVKDKDCYKISYDSLKDIQNIIRYLYKDANVGLSRKYERALEVMESFR